MDLEAQQERKELTWEMCRQRQDLKTIGKNGHGYIYAAFTDQELQFYNWPAITEEQNKNIETHFKYLLELRIFDQYREYRLMRTDLGKSFHERYIDDKTKCLDCYDEKQFMDIAKNEQIQDENGQFRITATGGGHYCLPFACGNDQKIIIRNYIDYYEQSGQAYVKDWRIVGFEGQMEGENYGEQSVE